MTGGRGEGEGSIFFQKCIPPPQVTLWDTGGLERYDSITANYYRYCQAVILVYDLDAEETLYCLRDWLSEARQNNRYPDKIVFSLWGNKSDLDEQSTKQDAVKAFLLEYGIPDSLHFKVSAKTDENVTEAFLKVIQTVDDRFDSVDPTDMLGEYRDTENLTSSTDSEFGPPQKGKKCCLSK